MPDKKEAYTWRENPACVATYRILEGDSFLDQFEDAEIPFAKAGTVKLGNLRYFPKTTDNDNIVEMLAINMARRFLTLVVKTFTVKKQHTQSTSAEIIESLTSIFKNPSKTICDLAEAVDDAMEFPNET
jgi:hypothetical protein